MTEVTTATTNSTPPAAVARKRRREILLSQRSSSACSSTQQQQQQQQQQQVSLESQKNVELAIPSISSCPTDAKRQKVDTTKTGDMTPNNNSNDSNSNKNSNTNVASTRKTSSKPKTQRKKANTQMRYDPDIPMTKEEAAAWRREARRVRNRESAAASRQKTRDRIVQLEGEVEEWKKKYEEVMAKLQQVESSSGGGSPVERCRSFISPCSSPCRSPTLPNLPLCSSSLVSSDRGWDGGLKEKEPHLNEMISRPAVKITGAATSIPEPHPDSCVSAVTDVIPASIGLPATTGLVSEDGDLEDFLLDALEGLEQEKEMFSISN